MTAALAHLGKQTLAALAAPTLTLGLVGCSPRPDYTEAAVHIVSGMSTPTVGFYWSADGSQVTRTRIVSAEVVESSYPLADPDALWQALHAALNPPKQELCPDASPVEVHATDSAGQEYLTRLTHCGRQSEVIEALIDQLGGYPEP